MDYTVHIRPIGTRLMPRAFKAIRVADSRLDTFCFMYKSGLVWPWGAAGDFPVAWPASWSRR